MTMKRITLSHGSGGKLMHDLIKGLFVKNFGNPFLNKLGDSTLIHTSVERFAYTTDSYVINPIFFPGGDIGKLSICGTVNDLSVSGARPKYISCGMIVEEGFSYNELEEITLSMKAACKKAGVSIVTGDFKVVEKGAADKIFINTSGIGEVFKEARLSVDYIRPGDKVIVSGTIGDHGAAVLLAREELKFSSRLLSDCAPINGLVSSVICKDIKFIRDPTRGGLATTLNEISMESSYNIGIDESQIPIKEPVKALCEILGLEPLYMANEGKIVLIVSAKSASKVLGRMKKHILGRDSKIIGEVETRRDRKVYLKTKAGGTRILDMLTGEQLPRIC
ncbi:MAG: hydrogenase expression/formation protein HypE [Candidatus Omnitrophica bacterium]|nr:hydrogenase expression/formation protein HypE [Candidatus Omnitrophota bacterium]